MDRQIKILVVDDEFHLRQATLRVLAQAGYETLEAATGEEGLHLAQEHHPDLILLDVVMPGINGVEVCRRIKTNPDLATIFVVLLSSVETASEVQAVGLETGADGYITRPVSNRELLARVEALVRIITAEAELRVQHDALKISHRQLGEALVQLQHAQEKLVRQERLAMVGQLAGGFAHYFNNMLLPIMGHAELGLMKISPDDDLYPNLVEIKKAADRAANLVSQILAFSRKQRLQIELLNLNTVITGFEQMFQQQPGADIELQITLDPALKQIEADKIQIEQVLSNLAANARDAMPHRGRLTLETANILLDEQNVENHINMQPGSYVLLTVSDTGHGMDVETRKHIFEPFFTTKGTGQGTGLGLSTVYGIVRQHDGHIRVFSEPNQGTTFKIYFPQVEDTVQIPDTTAADLNYSTKTVLIVEDELLMRDLACKTLKVHEYNVIEAKNLTEGLQLATSYQGAIHLLLIDMNALEKNGVELYQKLIAIQPDIRVLYMSDHTDYSTLSDNVNFLEKPFTIHNLIEKVKKILS